MVEMGFTLEEIRDSLENNKFNNVTATYFLLGTNAAEANSTASLAHPPPGKDEAAAAREEEAGEGGAAPPGGKSTEEAPGKSID